MNDRLGDSMATGHCLNDKSRGRDRITSGKNTRTGSGESAGIDGDGTAPGQAYTSIVRDKAQTGPLANCKDDSIAADYMCSIGHFLDLQPAAFIKAERFDLHALDAFDPAAAIA